MPGWSALDSILLEERMVAYLDPGAEWVLRSINEPPGVNTTSSCMGRIVLIEGEWPWERRETTRIVYKTHYWLSPRRLALELAKSYENLWLKATGPIIHLRVESVGCSEWLLRIAREEGFKHSGAITLSAEEGCCVLEITAPTGFSAPLRLGGVTLVTSGSLAVLASRASRAVALGRKRMARLALRISREWRASPCASP